MVKEKVDNRSAYPTQVQQCEGLWETRGCRGSRALRRDSGCVRARRWKAHPHNRLKIQGILLTVASRLQRARCKGFQG